MTVTRTMRGMGRSARARAESVGHSVKDRALEKRLERASDEADRLRLENDLLRDEVSQSRTEHHRILDLLENRLAESERDEGDRKKSHKGRWLLFVTALGGGAYAMLRKRSNGHAETEWDRDVTSDSTAATPTQTGSATL
ncbi:MAG: hypothetical protein ACXWXQ_03295 [Actinomycetota bacterium]